jgi:hypothetical protein
MKWLFFGVAGNSLELSSDEELILNGVTIKTFSAQNKTGCFYTLYVDRLHFSNSGTFVCKITNNRSELAVDYLNLTVTGKEERISGLDKTISLLLLLCEMSANC